MLTPTNQFLYTVHRAPFEEGRLIVSCWDEEDQEWLAEDCAKDHHRNHDGWESSWPLDITIYRLDGSLVGVLEVDRDVEPVFSAREI